MSSASLKLISVSPPLTKEDSKCCRVILVVCKVLSIGAGIIEQALNGVYVPDHQGHPARAYFIPRDEQGRRLGHKKVI